MFSTYVEMSLEKLFAFETVISRQNGSDHARASFFSSKCVQPMLKWAKISYLLSQTVISRQNDGKPII